MTDPSHEQCDDSGEGSRERSRSPQPPTLEMQHAFVDQVLNSMSERHDEGNDIYRARRECERLVYPCPRMYASSREAKFFDWDAVQKQLLSVGGTRLVNVQPCGRWSALHQAVYGGRHGNIAVVLQRECQRCGGRW